MCVDRPRGLSWCRSMPSEGLYLICIVTHLSQSTLIFLRKTIRNTQPVDLPVIRHCYLFSKNIHNPANWILFHFPRAHVGHPLGQVFFPSGRRKFTALNDDRIGQVRFWHWLDFGEDCFGLCWGDEVYWVWAGLDFVRWIAGVGRKALSLVFCCGGIC